MLNNNKKGFTLIELLIVVAIIGVLAAFAGIKLVGAQKSARDANRQSDLKQYQNLLEVYANSNNSRYPIEVISANVSDLCGILGAGATCEDDSDNPYQYQTDASGFKYVLWAKLEKLGYFVLCSNGLADKYIGVLTVSDGICPI